jgi:hypothetical protein
MLLHDWLDWSNSGIGAVGLVITVGALFQATGAKRAARQAVGTVRRHNAEVDFSSLARVAKELHCYVEDGKMSEARLRTTDLRLELATAIRNHGPFLQKDITRLTGKQIDLKLVTQGLNSSAGALSATERNRLLTIIGEILDLLAGIAGQLSGDIDQEGGND